VGIINFFSGAGVSQSLSQKILPLELRQALQHSLPNKVSEAYIKRHVAVCRHTDCRNK
jgi:hypothetical protein